MFRPRDGFTLVELIVVVAIIGVLIAVLLPAIQAVRGAARQAQCANHLKQIGLAIHNYATVRGSLPPGNITLTAGVCHGDAIGGVTYPSQDGTNWLISILPYLEQQSLYDSYSFHDFNESYANSSVRQTSIDTYICPADLATDVAQIPATGPAGSYALSLTYMPGSYRAMTGRSDGYDFMDTGDTSGYSLRWRGAIHTIGIYGYHTERWKDIRDGTSNTLMAGESSTQTSPQHRTLWAYSYAYYSLSAATPQSRIRLGDFNQCAAISAVGGDLPCLRGWGSNHGDGQNFVACDGSVRFITGDLDPELFAELATIDGGEVTRMPD